MNIGGEIQRKVLSPSQTKAVLECLNAEPGKVLFVTGEAGTGKSTVLAEVRDKMSCLVCAPTGLAAINVRGMSCHSTFRLPIGTITGRAKVNALNPDKRRMLESIKAVVIDEISMVRADMLDGINWVMQKTLMNDLPFGGKPLIVIGDMFQLEPVVTEEERGWMDYNYRSPFWFDAQVFKSSKQEGLFGDTPPPAEIRVVKLTEVFRQKDEEFIKALNAVRVGDPSGLELLNKRVMMPPVKPSPVALTYTNRHADTVNQSRLVSLKSDAIDFTADVDGEFKASEYPCAQVLSLKVGAQVMITRNLMSNDFSNDFALVSRPDDLEINDQMVANGSVGTLVSLYRGDLPVVELNDGRVILLYRALWEKIRYVFNLEENKLQESIAGTFTQFPMKLAWAVTTHKSQGQTMDAATLTLEGRTFAHGQLYVALSRVRSMDGLYLQRRITPSDLMVNPRVIEFMGEGVPAAIADAEKERVYKEWDS